MEYVITFFMCWALIIACALPIAGAMILWDHYDLGNWVSKWQWSGEEDE
jgi:hypothetical protein